MNGLSSPSFCSPDLDILVGPCSPHCLEDFSMMVFVLKGLGGDWFTFFHGVSALIIDLVSWHSSSCSMDFFLMRELCFPSAKL
jgi:hypothetical protein